MTMEAREQRDHDDELRDRTARRRLRPRSAPHGAGGQQDPSPLEGVRRAGEAYLSAADAAIDRALSGNSEQFVRASRQQGGE
jgi:hypothetical protein